MGTPLIENPEGIASVGCFGFGKPFGAEGVPHIITMHYQDWIPAGRWDESYRQELETPKQLYQDVNPLHWHARSDNWHWHVQYLGGVTHAWITSAPAIVYAFRSLNLPACSVVLPNDLVVFNVVIAIDGYVDVAFSQVFTS